MIKITCTRLGHMAKTQKQLALRAAPFTSSGISSHVRPIASTPYMYANASAIQFQSIYNASHLSACRFFSAQPSFSTSATATTTSEDATAAARYASIVREIKADLIDDDVNGDGKIDAEELKIVLRKVGAFTDREILELSDLFYMGRGGASIKHEEFLDGIASIVGNSTAGDDAEAANATSHRRADQNKSHPLGLGSCSNEFMFGKARGV